MLRERRIDRPTRRNSAIYYDSQYIPLKILFGSGSLENLGAELDELGASRVMIVATPGRSSLTTKVKARLGDKVVETFDKAVVHVPEATANDARYAATKSKADVILAIGGGSAIGVAKAIALETHISIVAVPTTYGGSEMTPIWGITRNGKKETGRDSRAQPKVVIYDPDLTIGLPPETTASSGLNAIAHCIEALYAVDANEESSSAALEGLRLLNQSLPLLAVSPQDKTQREHALMGAWRAGFALATVQMSLHHKLCHTLGGSFNLPHAGTHAVLIPYTSAYNRDAAPDAMNRAAAAMEVEDAPTGILNLSLSIPAPKSLKEIGTQKTDINRAVDLAIEKQYPNPRKLDRDSIAVLLEAAYEGDGSYVTEKS
jgi:alcohol dehydrogenase class IV